MTDLQQVAASFAAFFNGAVVEEAKSPLACRVCGGTDDLIPSSDGFDYCSQHYPWPLEDN